MKRRYPEAPVAAVAGIVFDGEGRVLMALRGRPPAKDKWSFPGGVVRAGEELEDALKREIMEETGLKVHVYSLLDVSSRILRDSSGRVEYHYILLDYLCAPSGGVMRAGSDARDAAWVSMDRLSEYDTTRDAERVIRRGFEVFRDSRSL